MRPIEFRGRRVDNGQIVFGDLFHDVSGQTLIYVDGGGVLVTELAQLCGFDSTGAKVYEGDVLIDEFEQEYVATIYDRPNKLAALTLKR